MSEEKTGWGSAQHFRGPLLGRDEQLERLESEFELVREQAQTRIVTLVGPAGIGKTRLIQEFIVRSREATGRPVKVFRGSARDLSTPYGLFARFLRARFGLVEGMDPERAKAQVRTQVARVLEDRKVGDVVYFLGQLLGLPFPESPLTKALHDDRHQAASVRRAVFRSFIEADASTGPVILLFDDLHRAHDDSLVLLRYLLEHLNGSVLLLCAGREELVQRYDDWGRVASERHVQMDLGALDDEAAVQLMGALLEPCKEAAEPLIDSACAFAGGNPMMLEQMVRIYHDVGVLSEVDALASEPQWAVDLDKLSSAKLPLTIEDAVNARIAVLEPEERELLERASVMGSVFWREGLVALLRVNDSAPELWAVEDDDTAERMDDILAELVERDYVLKLPDSTFPGTTEYIFKHNKERVAIEMRLSAGVRRGLHRATADWMEHQQSVHSNEEYCAMLARHREAGGDEYMAGLDYLRAGNLARARYATTKASEHYQHGLQLVGDRAVVKRIEALHNHGDVLQLNGRIEDALFAFEEMLTLAFRLDLKAKGGAAHNRIGRLHREGGDLDDASHHLKTALDLFRDADDARGVASTIDDIGKIHWMRGEYEQALDKMSEGLERRQKLGDRRSIALSLNNLGLVHHDAGDFKSALEAYQQALVIRREIGDLVGVVMSLNNLGKVARDLSDFEQALKLFGEAQEVAKEVSDRNRLAQILTNVGETYYSAGQANKAIDVLRQAEELCDELGDKIGLAEALRGLGKAFMLQGDLTRARDCIGRAVDLFASMRSKVKLGSALRTLGEITAAGGWGAAHTKSAREYYARSVAIFEQTGNEMELARTYSAYARFLKTEPEFASDEESKREAEKMSAEAQTIMDRLRVAVVTDSSPGSIPR